LALALPPRLEAVTKALLAIVIIKLLLDVNDGNAISCRCVKPQTLLYMMWPKF
jgi:hypothetical protein